MDAQHDVLHPRNREHLTSLHSHTAAKKGNFLSTIEDIQRILDQSTILLEDQYLGHNHKNITGHTRFSVLLASGQWDDKVPDDHLPIWEYSI